MPTRLTKPVTRRIGRLVVTIDDNGITLRGLRKRRGGPHELRVSWEQAAYLADDRNQRPLPLWSLNEEDARGLAVLEKMGAKG